MSVELPNKVHEFAVVPTPIEYFGTARMFCSNDSLSLIRNAPPPSTHSRMLGSSCCHCTMTSIRLMLVASTSCPLAPPLLLVVGILVSFVMVVGSGIVIVSVAGFSTITTVVVLAALV